MQSTLSDLSIGERGVIEVVTAARPLAVRLMELGLVEGTEVRIKRRAPLGDPLELELRGYSLSIRADEARCVRVRREP
ncbi:MAG: ferrous iron transport protein A [Polyangiaceae bacterium]|nr:ferrous iron transport protein A [Polyangiaceae bacterium]